LHSQVFIHVPASGLPEDDPLPTLPDSDPLADPLALPDSEPALAPDSEPLSFPEAASATSTPLLSPEEADPLAEPLDGSPLSDPPLVEPLAVRAKIIPELAPDDGLPLLVEPLLGAPDELPEDPELLPEVDSPLEDPLSNVSTGGGTK
jgi:hypothetical protein